MSSTQQIERLKTEGYQVQIRTRGDKWQVTTWKEPMTPQNTASTHAFQLTNAVREMLQIRGIPNI